MSILENMGTGKNAMAISPISGKLMHYRSEEWAKENGYITDEQDLKQFHANDNIIDFNEYSYELLINGSMFYIRRKS